MSVERQPKAQPKAYAPRGRRGRKPQFNVRLDDDVLIWITRQAQRQNVSQSVVLANLVRKAIQEQEKQL